MANNVRQRPVTESASHHEEESNALDNLMAFYEEKKKTINTAVSVVLIAVVGYFAYDKLYKGPNDEKAANALYYPALYYSADSLNLALNGDGKHKGFDKLSKQFSGSDAGNLSHYYEGMSYLKMGDFQKAIKALQDFDGKGTLLAYQAWGALGQAYMETGNKSKAIDYFKKASSNKEDGLLTPMYLYQLGVVYEASNQLADAKSAFKRIKDEYPRSLEARDIDRELAKLGEVE
jgi:tetratricopeptide (TPR) repeat protein